MERLQVAADTEGELLLIYLQMKGVSIGRNGTSRGW